MKDVWLTNSIQADPCRIRRIGRKRIKSGWELQSFLVYRDAKGRFWVCEPGYLWDGPSYPSEKTIIGKLLKPFIGYRKKEGLLASSAQHDQMEVKGASSVYEGDFEEWEEALTKSEKSFRKFLNKQKQVNVYLNIREAASIYFRMLIRWQNPDQTITIVKAFRQFLGLLVFQPWYSIFTPQNIPWEKVEETE